MTAVDDRPRLRHALAAEWTRLWTVRTTWWCLLAAALLLVGTGLALGLDAASDPARTDWPPAWEAGELALLVGQSALLTLVLLAVTSEHATGAFVATLQWTPRRAHLLAARVLVPALAAVVLGLLLVLAADLAAWAAHPELRLTASGLGRSAATVTGVLVSGALLAAGAGLLLRGTAGTVATVFLLVLVLPFLLPGIGVGWLRGLGELLPGTAVARVLLGEPDLSLEKAVVLLVAWPAAALAAGAAALLRRDA